MANLILSQQRLWFGGYDLTGVMNGMALEHGAQEKENTTLGDLNRSFMPGVKSIAMNFEGLFDAAASDKPLHDQIGLADQPLSFAPATAVDGALAYTFKAIQGTYQLGAAHGDILSFSAEATAQGLDLARGTIMHLSAKTATGNGTARQLGAITATQKLHAALHVYTVSGSAPTLDVVVESDDDSGFASAASRLTFDQATGQIGQYLTLDGAVTDDWWRVAFTIGGGSPSFAFALILAIQ